MLIGKLIGNVYVLYLQKANTQLIFPKRGKYLEGQSEIYLLRLSKIIQNSTFHSGFPYGNQDLQEEFVANNLYFVDFS